MKLSQAIKVLGVSRSCVIKYANRGLIRTHGKYGTTNSRNYDAEDVYNMRTCLLYDDCRKYFKGRFNLEWQMKDQRDNPKKYHCKIIKLDT